MEVCATSLHCPGDPTRRSRGVNSRAGGQAQQGTYRTRLMFQAVETIRIGYLMRSACNDGRQFNMSTNLEITQQHSNTDAYNSRFVLMQRFET